MNAAAASHPPGSGEPTARLYRWGLLIARRRRVVFVIWLLLVVAALGTGIDYALFPVTRFREELADGADPVQAAALMTATAGRTVLVSGSTAIAVIAPLLVVNDTMMREVALVPMLAIVVLLAPTLSLLPAVLAWLGRRVDWLAPPLPRWLRWTRREPGHSRVTALALRRPLLTLVSGVVVLGGLSVFALQLRTGYDYGLNSIADEPAGRADATIAAAFGPGAISPIQVAFTTSGRPLSLSDLQAINRIGIRLDHDPRVASAASLPAMGGGPPAAATALAAARTDPGLATQLAPVVNAPDGATVTVMTITPREAFDSAQATSLVADLRRELPAELSGTGLQALVGGATSEISDLTSEINSKTPLALVLIVGMALLLLAAYCSPLIALTGLAGTMLSVGAAYGLVVIAFQKGAGQSLFGFQSPGFTQDYLPLSLLAVLTGLSTDYQVFLISRASKRNGSAATTRPAR